MANEPSTSKGPYDIHQQAPYSKPKPKHEIFLSHSGAQKNFTEQLYEDLTAVGYCPFLDKEAESLPKGEKFPPLLFQALRECYVAILVLSEEFFSSKWPMIELGELVQARASVNSGLKILPLFLGLDVKQVKDVDNQKRWQGIWQGWADEEAKRRVKKERINVGNWMKALSEVVGQSNGMEYNARVGEVTYREDVVAAVCKLVPPVVFDVSHVQAMPRICEAICKLLDEKVEPSSTSGCQTVGLFATGGSGKSTISKAMCNYKFGEFAGKVCHVEFGEDTYEGLRQKVLKELMGFDSRRLPEADKLEASLKNGMRRQMVFLVLDNVWEANIEEAKMYLRAGFKEGSKVLVTTRSLDILKSLNLKESDCMELPELDEEDATNLFLQHACNRKQFSQEEGDLIKRCVKACKFAKRDVAGLEYASSTHQYLPLALKVWGSQLGQINPLKWSESLESLSNHKFNHFDMGVHPLFSLLRQGYDALKPMNRQIFLDLALFFPRKIPGFFFERIEEKYSVVEWLKIFYNCPENHINRILLALRRNALLEDFGGNDGSEFRIHDLYLEFAKEEVKAGSFDQRRILYLEGIDIPFELYDRQHTELYVKRLGLFKSKLKSLKEVGLHLCPNVRLLQLYECFELEEVDVQGFKCLKSLDILGCPGLGTKFEGVEKLEGLVWLRWRDIMQPTPFLQDFSSLTALEVLNLARSLDHDMQDFSDLPEPPILSGCINLRELTMECYKQLQCSPDLSNLSNLRKIHFFFFHSMTTVPGLSFLKNLKFLSLQFCYDLEELPGLCDLVALELLDLMSCPHLSKLDGLEKLEHLHELIVSRCNLSSLDGLQYLTSLRRLDASGCKNLKEIPDCSQLQELETINLYDSGVCVVPDDFGRLAKSRILRIGRCVGLIEPVCFWWMFQVFRVCETTNGWIAPDFQFPEQSRSQLVQVITNVATYYLDEASFLICEEEFVSLGTSFTGPNSEALEVMGVDMVIKSLCHLENTGILSLFVAKYAAADKYWELLTDQSMTYITSRGDMPNHIPTPQVLLLSVKIVDFIWQQIREMSPPESLQYEDVNKLWRIQFILKHLTKNEIMAYALGVCNICKFIRLCLYHPHLRRHMNPYFDDAFGCFEV